MAKYISSNYKAVPFSADYFMLKLYGSIQERELFEYRLLSCKDLIYEISEQVLKNTNVVLDFGFWTESERKEVISRFSGNKVITIYMKLGDEIILERLENRNANLRMGEYDIDEPTFYYLSSQFQVPGKEESVIVFESLEQLDKDIMKAIFNLPEADI